MINSLLEPPQTKQRTAIDMYSIGGVLGLYRLKPNHPTKAMILPSTPSRYIRTPQVLFRNDYLRELSSKGLNLRPQY
jgi:hypothetical protein